MEKICLNKDICDTIKEARKRNCMSLKSLSYKLNTSSATVCRIENNKTSFISKNMANKLENILGIDIYIETDRTTENELLQKIKELTEENRRLKELLMEKWKH